MEIKSFRFDTKYLKMETDFIKLILKSFEAHTSNDFILTYEKTYFQKHLKFDDEKLFKVIDNLMIKRFSYELFSESRELFGKFSFINSYKVENNKIILTLAKEIFEIFIPETDFFETGMESLLCLKSNKSVSLYLKISNAKKEGLGFEIPINQLKDFLEIETEYNRFYDFERFVLKDVIDDINENSFSKVSYQKVKKGTSSTHKVEAVIFYMLNKKQIILKEETNELLELVKYRVKDLSTIHHMIRTSIKKNGYLFTKSNINFVLENKKKDIDISIIRALKENPSNHVQGLILGRSSTLIGSLDKYFPSPYDFKAALNLELTKLSLPYFENIRFINKLKEFEKTHIIEFEDEKVKIYAYYTDMGITKLRIYSKLKDFTFE